MFSKLQEDLRGKQMQELKMKEELENLKGRLRSEKQYLEEIISERDKLQTLCDGKDSALQVIIFANTNSIIIDVYSFFIKDFLQATLLEKESLEVRYAKLNSRGLENNIRKELVEANNQVYRCEFSNVGTGFCFFIM